MEKGKKTPTEARTTPSIPTRSPQAAHCITRTAVTRYVYVNIMSVGESQQQTIDVDMAEVCVHLPWYIHTSHDSKVAPNKCRSRPILPLHSLPLEQ